MDDQLRNDHAKTMLSSQDGTLEQHTHAHEPMTVHGNEQMLSAPKGEAGQVPAGRARLTSVRCNARSKVRLAALGARTLLIRVAFEGFKLQSRRRRCRGE